MENDETARKLAEFLVGLSGQIIHAPGVALEKAREHLGNLIALAAFCLGLWKWWVYREQILHERLFQYLRDSDLRLIDGQQYVLDAIERPAAGQSPKAPLFANHRLREILKRKRWDNAIVAANVEGSAQRLIEGAKSSIESRLKMAEDATALLRKQLATANIIGGAIASARATNSMATHDSIFALTSFRAALQIPGHERNVVAKELEAHQLRKLGMLAEAKKAYEEVVEFAPGSADYRSQRLAIARAKRYQAELFQAGNSVVEPDGTRRFWGSVNASDLLYQNNPESALAIRSNFAPFQGWDLVEQAETHFVTAFVARNRGNSVIAHDQLKLAETCFKTISMQPKNWRWFTRANRRLRSQANSGLVRIQNARANDDFDWRWLLPPLDQPKQQADGVGAGRSN